MTEIARGTDAGLTLDIEAFGPTSEALDLIAADLLRGEALRAAVGDGDHRLLSIAAVEPDEEDKPARPRPPERFRATVADYGRSRTLLLEGAMGDPGRVQITEAPADEPPVSDEEFEAAVATVRSDPAYSAKAAADGLEVFRPMPPLLGEPHGLPAGRRLIGASLFSTKERVRLEIVGVDLANGTVEHLHGGAPPDANPGNRTSCGAPASAGQPTTAKGTAGQVWVTVKQGSQTLWRFLAVRPGASSGLRGSGVELRFVDYKGRRALYRGHVPILNVKYDADKCGPFRDWQYQEGQIQATGSDVAPGFRLCSAPVKTIMDTGSDTGNFLGVGIYVDGLEVVLVSEMQAGWYRYVSEWRLHANGTIRPRFGFAATQDSCVCNVHHHHAYWRLDFDILSAGANRIREYNRVLCFNQWRELRTEVARPRSTARRRKWRVEHVPTGAGYEIRPGSGDGIAASGPDAPYGRGDLWFLRYRGSEIDDGMNSTSGPNTEANIAKWLNGETLSGQDVVVWYGAHFSHDISHQDSALHGHILGPTLAPVNWPS
jgi:hypothetical protein